MSSEAAHAETEFAVPGRAPLRESTIACALIALLTTLYLLSFSGQFRSIDEFAMYARVESLALGQGLATPQLEFSARHHPVGAFEAGQPLLAVPLYLLGKALPGASTVAAVMLFSALVTALTGGVLYLLVRRVGYGQGVAALTALAWGLGTTAWPYARSFFREPLLGLLWSMAALLCLLWHQTSRPRYVLGCLLVVAACAAVKISSLSAAPVFALALLWDPTRRRLRINRRSLSLLLVGLALAVGAALILWRLRYGGWLNVARYTVNYPWGRALLAAYGLLISPVKGILFFSPILLATLPGWRALARRRGLLVYLALGLTAALLYTYGANKQWHGGSVVWGPRFVVPLLPMLMLPFAAALADGRRATRIWVVLWSAIGLVVQAAAGTASWSDAVWQLVPAYIDDALVGLNGIPWWSWRLVPHSPALVQLVGWAPRQLDMLWLRTLSDATLACDGALGIVLAPCAALAAGALAWLVLRPPRRAVLRRVLLAASLGSVVLGGGALLSRSAQDSNDFYGLTRAEATQLAAAVSAPDGSQHALLYVSNDFFTYPWLGMIKGRVRTAWDSPHDTEALAEAARAAATSEVDRLWLVVDHAHLQGDVDPEAAHHALAREVYELDGRWVGGYQLLEYLPQRPMTPVPASAAWEGGITLHALALSGLRVAAGEPLLVDLWLTAEHPPSDDLTLFVHLTPESGATLAARDGQPGYGADPTSGWRTGEVVHERRAVAIPTDTPPGSYTLTVGWLNSAGTRVRPSREVTGPGADLADEIALTTVEILAAP